MSITRGVLRSAAVDSSSLLLAAVGVAMFIEGTPYFVAPRGMRRFLALVQEMTDAGLRLSGLGMMATGLFLAWLAMR